jgi:hypothetical protein
MTCTVPSPNPQSYLIGESVHVSVPFRDVFGAPADASTLQLRFARQGDTSTSTVSVTVDPDDSSIGHFTFTPDEPGVWMYRVETVAGAPIQAAAERTIIVRASALPASP